MANSQFSMTCVLMVMGSFLSRDYMDRQFSPWGNMLTICVRFQHLMFMSILYTTLWKLKKSVKVASTTVTMNLLCINKIFGYCLPFWYYIKTARFEFINWNSFKVMEKSGRPFILHPGYVCITQI